jgi:tetratricopeptide (TPR) repeat protein
MNTDARLTRYSRLIGDAAGYGLLRKACFMEGQYKQAVANLEAAVREDSLNSEYYDWLGRAYGRLAEGSSFLSALGYAKKTVRAFEKAIELGPSNIEALSDVFEYYLQARNGRRWADKAGNIAGVLQA